MLDGMLIEEMDQDPRHLETFKSTQIFDHDDNSIFHFSAATAQKTPAAPYLSTLSQGELEKLGLKAVAAGANPQKLQQAFATAQLKGDWTQLEKQIADVLGIQAINSPQVGLAAAAASQVSQLLTGSAGKHARKAHAQQLT